MKITLTINTQEFELEVEPHESLLRVLRDLGFYGTKFGSEDGEDGASTVLINGVPVDSVIYLAAQADGKYIETIESIGEHPQQGWLTTEGFHPLQHTFMASGAIQSGYSTPAMILAAKHLLEKNPYPTEQEVRDALSGILDRESGYLKPVQAVMHAAAVLRGEAVPDDILLSNGWEDLFRSGDGGANSDKGQGDTIVQVLPKVKVVTGKEGFHTVGQPEIKVDAQKLVQGKPAFTADYDIRDLLHAKVLKSPHAHARIKSINTDKARALEGVAAVLTHEDIPRIVYSTAGQSDPIPGPLDTVSLDYKVRYVGDRVAFVAAETPEIAEKALQLIDVEYEVLPSILDARDSMKPGVVIIHDQSDFVDFDQSDKEKNLAAEIRIDIGDVNKGFETADRIFEHDFEVPKVQQSHIEPHVCITWWDSDDRLVIRTSTQVPFHARRMLAPVLGLPVKRIRVIKPRIGGGFGGKQEVQIEDVAAHLTIATGRPVQYEYTREEEFTSSRSRHPMRVRMKTGVKRDGTITANEMYCLSDTGAYGCHALTVTGNTGHKAMALYVGDGEFRKSPNIRFYADIVYTNTPPAGAYRGYGVPQGFWPLERHMETIAHEMGFDPLEFRLKNTLRAGEFQPFSTAWNEGREPNPETIVTCGLAECVQQGKAAIGWNQKYGNTEWRQVPGKPHLRKGVGVALVMQGTAIPYLDMGGASIKMNDDGSFNLLIGATDLGTGSDTVLAQMAAEVLGVSVSDMIVYSSDTDFTPFDKGAYASSTTYISGAAVVKAAEKTAAQIRKRAAEMLSAGGGKVSHEEIHLEGKKAIALDGRSVTLEELAHNSLHHTNQQQIMGIGSFFSPVSPPPFAAQFAEVTVDIETGQVVVDKLVMAVDSGRIINPLTASGQIEGGMTQALGYAVCEEMLYDQNGKPRETNWRDYHIFRAHEMPELETIFVETIEPSHPFGVKAAAEIPMDGVAPAVGNAIFNACGASVDHNPATPERVWRALKN
ncbi:MAG: molybdopterin-dependent oxidoreductase [Anaerolineales bacterium]|nr:molybdopterin-dependent oxidoreductase [Anaerolineales bacterium]